MKAIHMLLDAVNRGRGRFLLHIEPTSEVLWELGRMRKENDAEPTLDTYYEVVKQALRDGDRSVTIDVGPAVG
jgi:hypothetical protein